MYTELNCWRQLADNNVLAKTELLDSYGFPIYGSFSQSPQFLEKQKNESLDKSRQTNIRKDKPVSERIFISKRSDDCKYSVQKVEELLDQDDRWKE